MSNQSCYTRVEEIPWFARVADRAQRYLEAMQPEELSDWYNRLNRRSPDSGR